MAKTAIRIVEVSPKGLLRPMTKYSGREPPEESTIASSLLRTMRRRAMGGTSRRGQAK